MGFWTIPLFLTFVIWFAAGFLDKGDTGGGYPFGTAFITLAHLTLALIATLVVWLIYFIVF